MEYRKIKDEDDDHDDVASDLESLKGKSHAGNFPSFSVSVSIGVALLSLVAALILVVAASSNIALVGAGSNERTNWKRK